MVSPPQLFVTSSKIQVDANYNNFHLFDTSSILLISRSIILNVFNARSNFDKLEIECEDPAFISVYRSRSTSIGNCIIYCKNNASEKQKYVIAKCTALRPKTHVRIKKHDCF